MDSIKSKIKAIIFDMDGTIINTEQVWQNATLDTIQKYHNDTIAIDEHKALLRSLSGMGIMEAAHALKTYFKMPHSPEDISNYRVNAANYYLSLNVTFIDGFESFHQQLQKHAIPTCIASNVSPETLQKVAFKMNLTNFFGKNLYCSADVNNKSKPDPALFIYAAQQLEVQPKDCVVFEDSLSGFQAAKAASMKCIAIKNNINQRYLDHVHAAIANYNEAENVLKNL